MPVPVGVFCLGLSPQTCHQVEFINWDLPPTLLLPGVRLGPGWDKEEKTGEKTGERTTMWLEGDGRRPSGVSGSACRHHRERFISLRPQLRLPGRLSIIQMFAVKLD